PSKRSTSYNQFRSDIRNANNPDAALLKERDDATQNRIIASSAHQMQQAGKGQEKTEIGPERAQVRPVDRADNEHLAKRLLLEDAQDFADLSEVDHCHRARWRRRNFGGAGDGNDVDVGTFCDEPRGD